MSVDQLLEEVGKLTEADRQLLFEKLGIAPDLIDREETPEFVAFVDEGVRSAAEGPLVPIEDVIEELRTWNTTSS